MKANFETIAAIIVFIVNAGSLATIIALLDIPEIKDLNRDLNAAIRTSTSDPGYVYRKSIALARKIFSPILILLHLLNLAIYAVLALALIVGPDKLFTSIASPTIVPPFSSLETVIFTLWLVISLLSYISRCAIPTIQNIRLISKSRLWLRKNDTVLHSHR